jgi:cytochrome c-type biogenesis protein CcmH/NrfG
MRRVCRFPVWMTRLVRWALGIAFGIGVAWLAWLWFFPDPLAAGLTAYAQGAWGKAEAVARRRLVDRPGDREAWRLLARAAGRQGRDTTAQTIYRQHLGLAAMTAEDYVIAAAGLSRMGQTEQARIALGKARAREPGHAEMLHDLARLDVTTLRFAEGAELAEQLTRCPGWELRGWLILGQIHEARGDPSAAVGALQRALQRDPLGIAPATGVSASRLRKRLARALLQTSQPAEARTRLADVLAAGPDAEASWLLSRALLQQEDFQAASAALNASDDYGLHNPTMPEPAPLVGIRTCAACHPQHYRSQQASRHARAFRPTAELAALPAFATPVRDSGDASVYHVLKCADGRLQWETTDNRQVARAVVDYAFGAGYVSVTLVGHDTAGVARELRLSLYGETSAWEVTTGHDSQPVDRREFLGRDLGRDGVRRCFECHTTDARSALLGEGPTAADRGITCERCHGPGANHLKAVAHEFTEPAIARPRLASARQSMALCAACHRPKDVKLAPGDHLAPRFASPSLAWSACYTESDGGLSCMSCHDPHKDAEQSPAFYEARCLACHSNGSPAAAPSGPPDRKFPVRPPKMRPSVCPIQPARACLDCHMPKVGGIVPHARFTDHHIRVRHDRPSRGKSPDPHSGPAQ